MNLDKRIELAARLLGNIAWSVGDQPPDYMADACANALDWADALITVAEGRGYNE